MGNRVRVSLGRTINVGDFNSVRLDIAIEADSLPDEKVGDAVNRVYGVVERKLNEKVDEALGNGNGD